MKKSQWAPREKQSICIFIAAVVLWFAENIYFGWNAHSHSTAESICDFLVIEFFILSWLWKPSRVADVTITHSYHFNNIPKGTTINAK